MSLLRVLTSIFIAGSLLLGPVGTPWAAPSQELNKALLGLKDADKAAKKALYQLIERQGDADLVPLLEAYYQGMLEIRDGRFVIYGSRIDTPEGERRYPLLEGFSGEPLLDEHGNPLLAEKMGSSMIRCPRGERKIIRKLVKRLSLQHSDSEKRIAAIHSVGASADSSILPVLREQMQAGADTPIMRALEESIARIEILGDDPELKVTAAKVLGQHGTLRAASSLRKALENSTDADSRLKVAVEDALAQVHRHQRRIRFIHDLFAGLSLGSILVLMGLGLAVTFGLMGVINMAHGEFMMIGAFTAFVVCEIFTRHLPPEMFDYYFLCAIPAAFLVAAAAGWFCEWALVRHLYGRPLETLLATWGVSLILIQTVRVIFGDTLALVPPEWLKGSWDLGGDLALPINRVFIIIFSLSCALAFYLLVQKTKLGLLLRATVQDRDTASSLGVPIRRVDGLTFALGTGFAGLAGCVIPLYDKINPGMGQGYIVESFMVVVLGGLGKLAGVIIGGLGLGFLTKFIEPFLQAVYGKVVVLGLIILFLQWRPSGLFPSRGRAAQD